MFRSNSFLFFIFLEWFHFRHDKGIGFYFIFSVTILFTGFVLIYHETKCLLNVSRLKTRRKKIKKISLIILI